MPHIVPDGTPPDLVRPVAVFDAGIGSYAAVAALRRLLPRQDILYLADRASFPYGGKGRAELLAVMRRTLSFLDGFAPSAILVASNAPSITVLDEFAGRAGAPVFGVRPPVAQALDRAGGADVAVLGVRSMVLSPELRAHADGEAGGRGARVHLVDASPLVELVESGAFLFDPGRTGAEVESFLDALDRRHPGLGALTLSSTHLPWLRAFLERARPDLPMLDPIEDAVAAIAPHAVEGAGRTLALATEDERFKADDLRAMLARVGAQMPVGVVRL